MIYQAALSNLETLTVVFVLIPLSVFMYLAFYELKSADSADHVSFADNMSAFLILWITECIIIVLYYIHKNQADINNIIKYIDLFAILIVLASLFAIVDFIRRRHVKIIPLIPICSFISFSVFILLYLKVSVQIIYMTILTAHTLFSITLTLLTARNRKNYTYNCFIYAVCSAFIILLINTNMLLWRNNLILIICLTLSLLLTVSNFLFFNEIYSHEIMQKLLKAHNKNLQLEKDIRKISDLAFVDQLTQLNNIHKLQEDILSNPSEAAFLIMINFENYNNFINFAGQNAGNAVLKDISRSLQDIVTCPDRIYRYYSDKFIISHKGGTDSCNNLIEQIFNLFPINNYKTIIMKPYLGITQLSCSKKPFDSIIKELELSSEYAQRSYNYYAFYNHKLHLELQKKLELEFKIREAVRQNSWEIYFQPKVSLTEKKIIGAEALIRWKNKENSITPDIFIPLSEKIGLIGDIGKFVIRKTFEYINSLYSMQLKDLKISINISPYQLMDQNFFQYVTEALEEYSVDPGSIIFEITETALIHNIESVNNTILKLKALGIHFSLDDFGTGYSSLYHLSNLNLDEIKFDKTFTSSLPDNEKNIIILQSITNMAKQLSASIVIEGVEREEQFDCIKSIGCDYYQGYYFSKPIPFDDFVSLTEMSIFSSIVP